MGYNGYPPAKETVTLLWGPLDGAVYEVPASLKELWRGTKERPALYERSRERDRNGRIMFIFIGRAECCGK